MEINLDVRAVDDEHEKFATPDFAGDALDARGQSYFVDPHAQACRGHVHLESLQVECPQTQRSYSRSVDGIDDKHVP